MSSKPEDPPREVEGHTTPRQGTARGALLLLGFFLGGCASATGSPGTPFGEEALDTSVRIYVTNLNFSDATLWAVTQGSRRRLGILTGKTEEVFTLPWETSLDLQIEIDLLAGPRCTTRAMPVDPGDDIELIIDQDLARSALCGGGS